MTKRLIMMVGLPGGGKSTKANSIADAESWAGRKSIILSTDDIISGRRGEYLFSHLYAGAAHELNKRKCNLAMELEYDTIIIDNTNLSAKDRKPYIELAAEYEYEVKLVEPDTVWRYDPYECFRRNTHNVPLETLLKMKEKLNNEPL